MPFHIVHRIRPTYRRGRGTHRLPTLRDRPNSTLTLQLKLHCKQSCTASKVALQAKLHCKQSCTVSTKLHCKQCCITSKVALQVKLHYKYTCTPILLPAPYGTFKWLLLLLRLHTSESSRAYTGCVDILSVLSCHGGLTSSSEGASGPDACNTYIMYSHKIKGACSDTALLHIMGRAGHEGKAARCNPPTSDQANIVRSLLIRQ